MIPRRMLAIGTSGGGGDWPPLVAAALALHQRGHDVTFFGDEALVEAVGERLPTIEAAPHGKDLASYLQQWRRNQSTPPPIGEWITDILPTVRSRLRSFRPEVLVCQAFSLPIALTLRAETGIPVCLIYSSFYVGAGSRRTIEDDFAPGAVMLAKEMVALTGMADLVLLATDPIFDPPPDPVPPRHDWVGPLVFDESRPEPTELRSAGHPWALVTLSSVRQDGESHLARAALESLARFPLRVLVTLGDLSAREDLSPLPSNARVEAYVPHDVVLEQSALCVSHAGHGIVSKALLAGVPMVLIPWDRDQPGVAARAEALGVARVVGRNALSEERLSRAIREVLSDESFKRRAAVHSRRMMARDSGAQVCSRVEALLNCAV